MELTKDHRLSLLNALEAAQQENETHIHFINDHNLIDGKQWFEAKHFLSSKLIELIKTTLAENKMDY